ncbi:MAG: sensor histidine kinase [Acidobacteriota bacterium]
MIGELAQWLGRAVVALHRRLIPVETGQGWTPYLWLVYLGFFVWWGIERSSSPWAMVATVVVFLAIYFDGFRNGGGRRLLWNIALIEAIAIAWTPFNPGAMTFFIYGAGFCGAVGPPRFGVRVLAAIVAVIAITGVVFGLPWVWFGITTVFTLMVGAVNIYFADSARKNADLRRSRDEVERLAAMAERERIARDLHDLLGHTLSVITLKAELARKLAERGDVDMLGRIVEETADVERISRDALRQVREAVAGFRDVGLAGELARARFACDARGITFEVEIDDGESEITIARALGPRREAALALVLREAVTNVVRHSRASRCVVGLGLDGDTVCLRVVDDGRGGTPSADGSGLAGMRERLVELGGQLDIDGRDGWRLVARLEVDRSLSGRRNRADDPADDVAADLAIEGAGS